MQNCSIFDYIDEKSANLLKNYLKRKFNPLGIRFYNFVFLKIINFLKIK